MPKPASNLSKPSTVSSDGAGVQSCLGEIVATNNQGCTARTLPPQTPTFPDLPAFGSWVKAPGCTPSQTIYGVVCGVESLPRDRLHTIRPLGLSTEQLQQEHPEVFTLITAEFRIAFIGFSESETQSYPPITHHYLPPYPPQLHQPVHPCTAEEIQHFCRQTEFLRLLLTTPKVSSDELVAAVLRSGVLTISELPKQSVQAHRQWLVKMGRSLAQLLLNDYDKLRAITQKLEPAIRLLEDEGSPPPR